MRLDGRIALVSGGSQGIGETTASRLAAEGANVMVVASSNLGKAAAVVAKLPGGPGRHMAAVCDVRNAAATDKLAEEAMKRFGRIDILVNNAGVMALAKRGTTVDGFETQFATNYLSHFALTGHLLPLLVAAKARVVQLSSTVHRGATIHFDDLNYTQGYKAWPVYSQSKLAMLMFALELDRRSEANGWGITSVAAHPGVAATDLPNNGPNVGANRFVSWATSTAARMLGHSAADGALPQLMAATMPGVKGGQYFGPQGWKEYKGPPGPGKIDRSALDREAAARLWAESEKLTGGSFR